MNTDNINKDQELQEMAPLLAAIPKANPYKVPMNYFDNLESVIAKNVLATSLETIPKENPFEVPADYFNSLSVMIEQRVAATELSAIPKENPFEVPPGYFERLNSEITDKVIASTKQKGFEWIGLFRRPKLAVSFATLTLAVFIVFKVSFKSKYDRYSFSDQEISNSHFMNDIDEGTIIETLYSDTKTNTIPNQGEVENYLLDNNVDESQITGQL